MKTVLFACTHNAGRSQMAVAFLNILANLAEVKAISAGTKPAIQVHPVVAEVMKEVGIDLSQEKPTLLTEELASKATHLVTMGCDETCPIVPGIKRIDWKLKDPKDKPIHEVREIRDQIKKLVQELIDQEGLNK